MSIVQPVFDWIQKYAIKSIVNAPCGGRDCQEFVNRGVQKVLGVNIQPSSDPLHVAGDLHTWRPDGEWDAAYINCIFCNQLHGMDGKPSRDFATLARNYASWPVKYLIVYDTSYDTDWAPMFKESGWNVIESAQGEGPPTRVEMWSRAA
mgnify:CR=1 FL=1